MQIPLPRGRAVGALTLKDRPCTRHPPITLFYSRPLTGRGRMAYSIAGKFDRPVEGEKPPGKGTRSGLPGKRRTFLPVAQGEAERAAVRAALGALERRDGLKSKLNAGRAVNAL